MSDGGFMMTAEELKIDLERDYNKYNSQVEESYERVKAASANKSENKLYFTYVFSILPWAGITATMAFNMPQIASAIPVEVIPYITIAGSFLLVP